jgi:hypothetical protein
MKIFSIEKVLSANDTGETGTHQAGMLVPKEHEILSFFPVLSNKEKNPRYLINLTDSEGREWSFNFIYYNNKLYGGTRNEYRLTGMTAYISMNSLKALDRIILFKNPSGKYSISYVRATKDKSEVSERLKLGTKWRVITIKK